MAPSSPHPAAKGRLWGFGAVLAFLSIIPVQGRAAGAGAAPASASAEGGKMADAPAAAAAAAGGLYSAARSMHLFPLAGIILGLGTGLLAWGLFESIGQPLLAGLLSAAAILIVTGLHHTDGLADFADGLMTRGDRARRLEAMRDRTTGTAGTVAVVLCVIGLVVALAMSQGGGPNVMIGIILAEMLAKFSMVVMAAVGRPATRGTGAIFADAMRAGRGKMAAASAVAVLVVAALAFQGAYAAGQPAAAWGPSPEAALSMIAISILIPIILAGVSSRSFGGITGDVFGAANETVRVASLAVFFLV